MSCPYLKEVVMLYCDAFPIKKMIPLDRLVSANPCLAQEFDHCPLYRETGHPTVSVAPVPETGRKEVHR
jgi:hypothetical protein